MIRYPAIVIMFILIFSFPASGMKAQLYVFPNEAVAAAAGKLRNREFNDAIRLSETAPSGGTRDFVAGIAAYKANDLELAVRSLESASKTFPLLADYSHYFKAMALNRLKKPDDALLPLLVIQKTHKESPVHRPALLLIGEIHYFRKDFKAAGAAYQKFIEIYPTGRDALTAQHRMALSREALGDQSAAVKILRNLWLTNPSSPLAAEAEEDLKRLVLAGAQVAPYTSDEIFKRGSTLFDLKKFPLAVTTLRSVSREGQNQAFLARLEMKTGQALYRARKYSDAERLFEKLSSVEPDADLAAEATYWLARCKDKNDRHEEAVKKFMQVADRWPTAAESDNALLEAAYIRKSQLQWSEVCKLIERLLNAYPDSSLKTNALWEAGWGAYKLRNWSSATDSFNKLATANENRDRALYWLSKSQLESGDRTAAETTYASLVREFPLSYYSLGSRQKQNSGVEDNSSSAASILPQLKKETIDYLPLPSNNERVRALIACGLFEEAKKELGSQKTKPGDYTRLFGIARLYLEMEDYNGAFNLFKREPTRLNSKEGRLTLSLQFPLPFRELVDKHSGLNGIPLPLLYAVMRAESAFSPVAISPAGAVGLLQLMPSTAAQIEGGGKGTVSNEILIQSERNIRYGSRHMKDLMVQYNNDLVPVIASYNAGGNAVNRWRKTFGSIPATEFIEQIPYGETREYVKQVIASTAIYSQLYNFPLNGIKLPLPPPP